MKEEEKKRKKKTKSKWETCVRWRLESLSGIPGPGHQFLFSSSSFQILFCSQKKQKLVLQQCQTWKCFFIFKKSNRRGQGEMRTEAEDLLGPFEQNSWRYLSFLLVVDGREPVVPVSVKVPVNLWKRHLRYCQQPNGSRYWPKEAARRDIVTLRETTHPRKKTFRFETANGQRRREMAVFRCRAALQLVGLIALMAATVPSDSAAPSGSVRSSKMKPPPIIPEESSNKNRRSSGKSLAFSSRCFFYRCDNLVTWRHTCLQTTEKTGPRRRPPPPSPDYWLSPKVETTGQLAIWSCI